jgi:hypothetical protein
MNWRNLSSSYLGQEKEVAHIMDVGVDEKTLIQQPDKN